MWYSEPIYPILPSLPDPSGSRFQERGLRHETLSSSRLMGLTALVLLTFCFSTAAWAEEVAINDTNFPDTGFQTYVKQNFDKDNDDTLSEAELESVTTIDVSYRKITDLTGIQYFASLTTLYCPGNQLTSLDLSQNGNLFFVKLGDTDAPQTFQKEVTWKNGWSFDLSSLVKDWSKVSGLQVTGAALASDGKTVTWTDGTVRPVITYVYETGYTGKNLPVTLTLIPVGQPAATAQEETKVPVVTSPAAPLQVAGQVGQWVTFTVTATDGQAYQWYLDRQDGQGMQPLAGATEASYSTQPLSADWNGYAYYCKVTSTAGSVISPAFVLALPQPTPAPAAGGSGSGSGSSTATPKPAATAKPTASPSATAAPEATATAEPSAAPQATAAPEVTTALTANKEESASFPWAVALGAAGVVLVIGVVLVVRRSRQG